MGGGGESSGTPPALAQYQQTQQLQNQRQQGAQMLQKGFQSLGAGIGTQTAMPGQLGHGMQGMSDGEDFPQLPTQAQFLPDISLQEQLGGTDLGDLVRRFGMGGNAGGGYQTSGFKMQ